MHDTDGAFRAVAPAYSEVNVATEFSLPESVTRLHRPFRILIEVMLVGLVAVVVAKIAWLVLAPEASVADGTERPLPAPFVQSQASVVGDRSLLVTANPFEVDGVVEVIKAPETQLNLRLSGLITSTVEGGGSAQITTPDNLTQRFVTGDEVISGVTLEQIMPDRVILNRNGNNETLMLGGRGVGLSVISDGSLTPELRHEGGLESPSPTTDTSLLEGRISDPGLLFQSVRLTPVQRDEELFGYAVNSAGSAETIEGAALRQGDILLEVNGERVSELDLSEILDQVGENQIAMLQIERAGNVRTVRLRFDE